MSGMGKLPQPHAALLEFRRHVLRDDIRQEKTPANLMTAHTANKSKGILTWPEDERPRERLLSRGSHALTDAELIAILLRVGVRGKSAVELGRELMKRFGSPYAMMNAPLDAWHGIKGLGDAKIAQLQAALELAR